MKKYKFNRFRQKLIYYYFKLYWFWILLLGKRINISRNTTYSIGITTFRERYDVLFKDLLKRIEFAFPNTEIIVAVNGHYDINVQRNYLNEIISYCKAFSNLKIVYYNEPQSLSKLWNQIILHSSNNKTFIFNDDILFKPILSYDIASCGILNEHISLLNDSFSHFMIDKNIIKDVGWFDERFPEIGGEDDDYHVRLELKGVNLNRFHVSKILSFKPLLKINSYGQIQMEQVGNYSNLNTKFLFDKWDIRKEPFEGSTHIIKSQGNYWKLKEGMETPDFYSISKLNDFKLV